MNPAHLVREARLRAGLTQAELAARAGTTQSALARLESGASSPAFSRVADLVGACGFQMRVRIVDADLSESPEAGNVSHEVAGLLAPLVGRGVRFVVSGGAAVTLRGFGPIQVVTPIVPDDARGNLRALGDALGELGARVRVEDGSLPLVRTPESLLARPRWELVTAEGPIDVVFVPSGTRGYRDLSRDASGVEAAAADPALVHRLRLALGGGPRTR